jgi:hypothetical protein
MKPIIYFGKALLMIVLPIVFIVISSIIIAGLFALIGTLMGQNTFASCFQSLLGNVAFVMTIITMLLWLINQVVD